MGKTKRITTKKLVQGAMIAAIYATLTIALSPISYGPMQARISEALTVLPALTPAAVPGLAVGCLVSNIIGPYGAADMIFGSAATLIAAFCSYKLRARLWLVPLPPVIANGLIIGGMLHFVYGVPDLAACMGWIALGELIVCYVLGYPLLKLLKKYEYIFE